MLEGDIMAASPNGNRFKMDEILGPLVQEVKAIDKTEEDLNEQLKQLKKRKTELIQGLIPDVMFEHGMTTATLLDDTKIEIRNFYHARVDKSKDMLFREWLRDHGHGGIIKSHFEVWARDSNTIPLLSAFVDYINREQHLNIEYEVKEDIHWKTLEKWFEEVTKKGDSVNLDLFINHTGREARIK